jgi:hypothetical protein
MIGWLRGWIETLRIMFFDRPLYVFLRDYEFDQDDFVDAPRPTDREVRP